ncbi:MAG TPA: hypothetical protein PLC37_10365, partial [Smithellaceae bacterium]|nr:hypothetical protein [Smithellaceae bacterium]HQG81413.1 hypothetical protein [Smithellaceae bacterium]
PAQPAMSSYRRRPVSSVIKCFGDSGSSPEWLETILFKASQRIPAGTGTSFLFFYGRGKTRLVKQDMSSAQT